MSIGMQRALEGAGGDSSSDDDNPHTPEDLYLIGKPDKHNVAFAHDFSVLRDVRNPHRGDERKKHDEKQLAMINSMIKQREQKAAAESGDSDVVGVKGFSSGMSLTPQPTLGRNMSMNMESPSTLERGYTWIAKPHGVHSPQPTPGHFLPPRHQQAISTEPQPQQNASSLSRRGSQQEGPSSPATKRADIRRKAGEKFPSYEELQLLPEEIRETLMQLVQDYFRRMIYPRFMFLLNRKKRRNIVQLAQPNAPTVSANWLSTIPFFSRWGNLEAVVKALELHLYERDELILAQGDTSVSGIYFLVQGTVDVRRRKTNSKKKGFSDSQTTLIGTMEPPSVYGEKIFLTEEPRLESLKAHTKCVIWVLKREPFFQLFHLLSEDKRKAITEYAYEQRRENIPKAFPVKGESLQRVPLFAHVPLDMLNALAPKMEPRVFHKDRFVCRIGDVGSEMYYVARGEIVVTMISVEGEETIIAVATAGSVVGEMAVLFSQKRSIALYTRTVTDVYIINHEILSAAIPNPTIMASVLQKAHELQAERQSHAKTRYLEFIKNIPFLKQLGCPKMYQKLVDAFVGRVYPLRSTILTVSECASRLVIFTRGKPRITSTGVDLKIGECLGFTCLIPHRWKYHVLAQETVESIELQYDVFKSILKQFNIYEEVKHLTLGLLYPRAYPDFFQKSLAMVRHCINPPCFPTSSEYDVKPFAARLDARNAAMIPVSALYASSKQKQSKEDVDALNNPFYFKPMKLPGGVSIAANAQTEAAEFMSNLEKWLDGQEVKQTLTQPFEGKNRSRAESDAGGVDPGGNSIMKQDPSANANAQSNVVVTPWSPPILKKSGGRKKAEGEKRHASVFELEQEKKMERRKAFDRLTHSQKTEPSPNRNAEEVVRLTQKIKELQRQQLMQAHTSPVKALARMRKLPPLSEGDTLLDSQLTENSNSPSGSPLLKKTRTIAMQTDASYLKNRAEQLARMKKAEKKEVQLEKQQKYTAQSSLGEHLSS